MPVLIAGVGYYHLRDLSMGPVLIPQLQAQEWPDEVEVDDFSFGPIAVMQRMEDRPGFFDRVVLLGGVGRAGRQPGQLYCYRWDGVLPAMADIQQAVSEGATGVVSLDNVLVIGGYFKVWPVDMVIIELEPVDQNWGAGFSDQAQGSVDRLPEVVRRLALGSIEQLPFSSSEVFSGDQVNYKQ